MTAMSSGAWCCMRPACRAASRAATTAYCAVRLVEVTTPEARCWSGSKPEMEAIWLKRRPLEPSMASGRRPKGAMPLWPAHMDCSKAGTVRPIGVMQPRPVITTRFNGSNSWGQLANGCDGCEGSGVAQAGDAVDDVTDGHEAAQRIVGNGDA